MRFAAHFSYSFNLQNCDLPVAFSYIFFTFANMRFPSRIFFNNFYFSFVFFHLAPVYIFLMHSSVFGQFFKFRGAFLNTLFYIFKNCDLPVAFFAFFTLSKIVICQLHFFTSVLHFGNSKSYTCFSPCFCFFKKCNLKKLNSTFLSLGKM